MIDYAELLDRLDADVLLLTNGPLHIPDELGLHRDSATAIRELLAEVRDLRDTREHLESLLRRAQTELEQAQATAWDEGVLEHGRLDPDGVIRNPYITEVD